MVGIEGAAGRAPVGVDPDLVAEVVDRVVARAVDGECERSALHEIVAAVRLPALGYHQAVVASEARGIRFVDEISRPKAEPGPVVSGDESDDDESDGAGWDADGFEAFMHRTRHDLLTAEQERELGSKVQRGLLAAQALEEIDAGSQVVDFAVRRGLERRVRLGRRAEEEFIEKNLRLVASVAFKHAHRAGPSLDKDDLFQEGVLGLAHAVRKFDPNRGYKFSTYATWWIRQSINRALANHNRSVRLPVHMVEALRKLAAQRNVLRASLLREPTVEELAQASGLAASEVRQRLNLLQPIGSLDRPVRRGGVPSGHLLPDPYVKDPGDLVAEAALRDVIGAALGALKPREREVLSERFGLGGEEPKTLEEIGQLYGLTRERIRQIEAKALEKLHADADRFALREFTTFRPSGTSKLREAARAKNAAPSKRKRREAVPTPPSRPTGRYVWST